MAEKMLKIPTQTEMYSIVLNMVKDGKEFRRIDIKKKLYKELGLDDAHIEKTSSGTPLYSSRAGWAITHLHKAGLISRPTKAVYCITPKGVSFVKKELSPKDFAAGMALLEANPEISSEENNKAVESDISPEESIDKAMANLNEQLADDIMSAIMDKKGVEGNKFFEKVVTDLLVKMGYGEGSQTQYSHDGGIDGIIKTDPLGFDPILIQAKHYAPENKIGSPMVDQFAGALKQVKRGVFITTSSFTKGAIQTAKEFPHAEIVLIDGKKLTELMIKHNLGVVDEREIHIKKLDASYFDEE